MRQELHKSASLRAAMTFGLGGVAFSLGNLVLARVLPTDGYGLVSLVMAIVSVASLNAPLGFDLVIGRRGLQLDMAWRRAVLRASALTALVTAILSACVYRLTLPLLLCVLIATMAGGAVQASAAHFQGQRRFGRATWILQLSNWALVPVALFTVLFGLSTATGPCVVFATAVIVGGAGSWRLVVRDRGRDQSPPGTMQISPRELGREALSLMTISASSTVFMQLERLLVAPTVGLHELAMYGVLASLVGSPFRMLQAAVQFTLIPALRSVANNLERRRHLRDEFVLVMIVSVAGSAVLWFIAPPIAHWFLAGRYDLSAMLMVAVLVSGMLKVLCAFALATVVALGDERQLRIVSAASWACVAISVTGAVIGAKWGLVGVLYGISAGWLVRLVLVSWIAFRISGTELAARADGPLIQP